MMWRPSFDLDDEATGVENAVARVIERGQVPADIGGNLGTTEATDAVIAEILA